MRTFRLATRSSPLALWQAHAVGAALGQPYELVHVETTGDKRLDVPIAELGERGVFSKEVQNAVLDGRADIAVHSAKDLPSSFSFPGLTLVGAMQRGDVRDVMVGASFADLPVGATVATGSVRRRAQLAALRPDLSFTSLRGNIGTRLSKLDDDPNISAIVMAAVALQRLNWGHRISSAFEVTEMVPQVGQGALAVECRDDDDETRTALALMSDADTTTCVWAERAFLAELGGGCDLPVGAYAHIADGELQLTGLLAALDGSTVLRCTRTGDDPSALGAEVATQLFHRDGGSALLDAMVRP